MNQHNDMCMGTTALKEPGSLGAFGMHVAILLLLLALPAGNLIAQHSFFDDDKESVFKEDLGNVFDDNVDIWDDPSYDIIFPSGAEGQTPSKPFAHLRTHAASPLDQGSLQALALNLATPLWRSTYPRRSRHTLDQPWARSVELPSYKERTAIIERRRLHGEHVLKDLRIISFFNKASRLPLTSGEGFNLNFTSAETERAFFTLLATEAGFGFDTAAEAQALFPMLKRVSVEERNLGAIFSGSLQRKRFRFHWAMPLMIAERNLITDASDEEQIRAFISKYFDKTVEDIFKVKREFVRLRMGIGDMRLTFGYIPLEWRGGKIDFGPFITLPTAAGILLDGTFRNPDKAAYGAIGELVERYRAFLLSPELGNKGHVGLGLYVAPQLFFHHNRGLVWSRLSYEALLPNTEDRMIIAKKTITPQQFVFDSNNLYDAFLQQYIAPEMFRVTARPGGVFMGSVGARYHWSRHWSVQGGYDFYLRGREELERVHSAAIPRADLDVASAEQPLAMQHKLFAEVGRQMALKDSYFNLNIGGDIALISNGIGADWTVFVRCGWKF